MSRNRIWRTLRPIAIPSGLLKVLAAVLFIAPAATSAGQKPIGFYVPWDPASLASLQAHANDLSVVVPTWVSVTGPDHQLMVVPDEAGHAALAALPHRPTLWLMIQNATHGAWDSEGIAALLADKAAVRALLSNIEAMTVDQRANGIVIDFEALSPTAVTDLTSFLRAAREVSHRHRWTLAVTVPAADPAWDLAAIGQVTDRVILMAYDQHWQTGQPGPIAANSWFRSVVSAAARQVPARRLIVGIAAYAYDWPAAGPAVTIGVEQARALANSLKVPLTRDADSGGARFSYTARGIDHQVWLQDAVTIATQRRLADQLGAASTAIWRLGTEDPRTWEYFK